MTFRRLAPLALLAATALTLSGCRAGGVGNLNSPLASRIGGGSLPSASVVLAEHNRNASRIQSFEAKPSIYVTAANRSGGQVDGRLAMERARNFKLDLRSMMGNVADIGSNDDEFWFWVRDFGDKGNKYIYYCNYDDLGRGVAGTALQPDWIVEALGLRVVPEEEMAEMTVKPGLEPGTLLLTQHASAGSGVDFTRETVVSEATHRIKEHRIFDARGNRLAEAVIADRWQEIPASPQATAADDKVFVPAKLNLKWYQEKLSLDVTLKSPKANPKFDDARRAALFAEPERKDLKRFNLAEMDGAGARGTTIRQSRPAPAPRVKRNEPAPLGADDTQLTANDPVALAPGSSSTPAPEELVEMRVPAAAEPEGTRSSSSGWRNSRIPPVIEQ